MAYHTETSKPSESISPISLDKCLYIERPVRDTDDLVKTNAIYIDQYPHGVFEPCNDQVVKISYLFDISAV